MAGVRNLKDSNMFGSPQPGRLHASDCWCVSVLACTSHLAQESMWFADTVDEGRGEGSREARSSHELLTICPAVIIWQKHGKLITCSKQEYVYPVSQVGE